MPEIDRTHIRAAQQETVCPLVHVTVDRRRHEADAALAIAVVLLQPEDAVVRERLDRAVTRPSHALRDTFDGADRETTRQPTRDLGGAKNPARVRRRGVAVQSAELRIATYAAGIEQALPA